jgi:bacteriorhodopsin
MGDSVQNANKLSLGVQAITGLLGAYGLTIPLAPKDAILRQVLGLEMIVQIIEFVFYLSFVSILNLKSLTQERYYDWFLSTPIMLFTISLYFFYVNFIESEKNGEESIGLLDFAKNNSTQLTWIVILNFLMLLFGFLAEKGIMNKVLAFILGTGALCGSFGIIYENYAKYSEKTRRLFWVMFGLWSMYGVAFLCPPVVKNLSYTVLDIFAKNFFGIFLSFVISQKTI